MSTKTHVQIILLTLLIVATTLAGIDGARSQIIRTPNIDQLCKEAPPLTSRKTVVYIDLAAVRKASSPQWGLTILHKLELAPRESLTISSVNPATFEIKEELDICYPKFSDSEIIDERKSRSVWDKLTRLDPADQQKENVQTFQTRLSNALNRIEGDSKKFKDGSRLNILGAISLDKNRYSDRIAFYRVIIYTDGTIKEASSDDKKSELAQNPADKYLASFSGADVAVFGIDSNSKDGTIEPQEKLFTAFFLKSWAHLRSFSPSLPQQDNFLFPPATRMDGTFDGGGTQGSLRLALFSAKQSTNGWLAFNVGRETLYVPFQGEYSCEGENCRLNAVCSDSVPPNTPTPYFRKGDKILLSGKAGHNLEGSLQADTKESFTDGKKNVKYELKFSSR